MSEKNELAARIKGVREKIENACRQAGRDSSSVKLVAVSKKVNSDRVRLAYESGIHDFGENYIQEALPKIAELSDASIRWHCIGALQSNKAKMIADRFYLIHSIDRLSTLKQISLRSAKPQDVLIEVNLIHEPSKSGISPADLPAFLETAQLLPNVRLRGFMFMPPLVFSDNEQDRYFAAARSLRDRIVTNVSAPHTLEELSMGTSHDFEVAIKYGATIVRVGTAIFGDRPAGKETK